MEYYDKYRVRRYGFHGTSHKFVAKRGAEFCGLDLENSKIVTCHVGNGGSVTAVLNGKSYCTSMGFSPVDGLMMGTRCGDVDPSAVLYIAEHEGMNFSEINTMINKKSGVEAGSGVSSDMRDIDDAYEAGNERAILARDMYYDRVKQYVGKYAALMGGCDLLIFTGGVGENSNDLRRWVSHNMEWMGIEINDALNDVTRGTDTILSTENSKVKVAVIATNEELVIAQDTYRLINA